VHIGIVEQVTIGDFLSDDERLLRCGSIIEVHQGLPVDRSVQYREIFTNGLNIKHSV
jgi:hypothetical protein